VFGRHLSDHMLEIDWDAENGWHYPVISPYHNFAMDPASLCLHYAIECFEGMKAYIDNNKAIRMFRPMDNMHRLNSSAERIALPKFPSVEFLECTKELLRVDRECIPDAFGYSLYIRPTFIATQGSLGVQATNKAKLYVITSPVGPYYKTGFKPVKLLADSKNARAFPGGVGNYKLGCNYAPGIKIQKDALAKGYQQILWLLGKDHIVTEVGTMNFFVFWTNEQGEKELVTAPLNGVILPGVTRQSVLDLTRSWGEFKVSEREFTMHDMVKAIEEKRIIEAFGAGTAAIISPVNGISFNDKEYQVPLDPKDSNAGAGPLASRLNNTILAIQYGREASPKGTEWSIVV